MKKSTTAPVEQHAHPEGLDVPYEPWAPSSTYDDMPELKAKGLEGRFVNRDNYRQALKESKAPWNPNADGGIGRAHPLDGINHPAPVTDIVETANSILMVQTEAKAEGRRVFFRQLTQAQMREPIAKMNEGAVSKVRTQKGPQKVPTYVPTEVLEVQQAINEDENED